MCSYVFFASHYMFPFSPRNDKRSNRICAGTRQLHPGARNSITMQILIVLTYQEGLKRDEEGSLLHF